MRTVEMSSNGEADMKNNKILYRLSGKSIMIIIMWPSNVELETTQFYSRFFSFACLSIAILQFSLRCDFEKEKNE